jgi:hypothetical protein
MKPEIVAAANAIEKTAEFGTQALQTSEKAGGFIAKVFKEPIEGIAGIFTDRIHLARLRRWDGMADEVIEILKRRGITDTRAVMPKFGLPLLEAAALEDDVELQKLWSGLLANAMDPRFTPEMRTAYTEIIKGLTGQDALILQLLCNSLRGKGQEARDEPGQWPFKMEAVCNALQLGIDDYSLSVESAYVA